MLKYWTGGQTKHRLLYHLVFTPKYRKRILKGKIATSLTHMWYEAVKVQGWWIEELHIMEDHVHILIQLHTTDKLSDVVQKLKGGSSYYLQKQYPEIEEFIWGDSFWSDGYFAETVGKQNFTQVKEYIKNQQKKD